ncbi:uncharacterized protein LTR77_001477 [Saxophila tyrrhenica]|uniref:Uncharacterized protein n=1 Tax=Saxophila tyrrhenica TaxID=1690608 RepID=A0AAV9PQ07_9PEZI|nr:hypothetical protein LTR77_001477 [Saxophila tyrrhenica]
MANNEHSKAMDEATDSSTVDRSGPVHGAEESFYPQQHRDLKIESTTTAQAYESEDLAQQRIRVNLGERSITIGRSVTLRTDDSTSSDASDDSVESTSSDFKAPLTEEEEEELRKLQKVCREIGVTPGEDGKACRKLIQKVVLTFFHGRYPATVKELSWRQLCQDVGVEEGSTIEQCEKNVKGVYINIVDFMLAIKNDKPVVTYKTEQELREYIRATLKIFPLFRAEEHFLLQWMLIVVFYGTR